MKRIFVYIAMCLGAVPMFSQVKTSLALWRGAAGEALSLQQLKDSALRNNIAMRTAQLDIEVAQQQRKEAFTNFFPNVNGTGMWFNANRGMAKMDMNPSEMISPEMGASLSQMLPAEALAALGSPVSISMMKNGTIGSLMAVQPIFAGGQIINGNKLAKVGVDVSRLQFELSEDEVLRQTEQYYWQLVSMQQKVKTVEAVESLLQGICKDVDVAVRAGVAMNNDLLQVQLRQNEIESQKLKLENGISIVSLLLAQYCGLGCDSLSIEVGSMSVDDSSLVAHVSDDAALRSLPEYQLLLKQVEAAKLQRKIEVGKNLPSVGIGAGYNYHNLMDNDRTFGMVFATVSVPISDWWGGSHAIKRRKMQQQKAEAQFTDNSQLLKIRMQKAWNDVQESYRQLGIARRSIEQAEENLRLNKNYYKAGTCRMSDLLEAQSQWQQTHSNLIDAYAQYKMCETEYRRVTGGL